MTESFIGRTLGDFLVRSRLGAGGAGEVYIAEQLTLGREAVIKVLTRRDEISQEANDRFLREARLASRLDHPFAAHVYAFGIETDGTLWIAMELVRGRPLDQLVEAQGVVPLARFVPFFERLCEVLNAAHDQGIVHRDIKPANVMVLQRAGRWLPKLLDLGIARLSTNNDPQSRVELADEREMPQLTELPLGTTLGQSFATRLTRSESLQLTSVGSVVGTPHYMAPEQWLDASTAGTRADVYSLAILAYQCLTGRLPFDGKSLRAVAKAHLTQPLPSPGDSMPAPLFAVLQKGAAKAEAERFDTPLAFAAALRAASGLELEPPALPQLETGLRDTVLGEAPQPLAEAVLVFDAAKTARMAVEATRSVEAVLSRYLGVLALATRVRIGAGGGEDSVEVTQLLSQLRANGLTPLEWLRLTRALVKPFAGRPDAHVLPELVQLFFGPPADGVTPVDTLLSIKPPSVESDEQAVVFLNEWVARLGAALERVSFLFDYALVVQRTDPERWMGTRKPVRQTARLKAQAPRDEVMLVDANGSIVLSLSPFMQCSVPSGGAPAEVFIIDGPARHGARLVALPGPFERQDERLWETLAAHGLLSATTDRAISTEKAPYKGLSTFGADDAENYFGREREAEAFANRLRREPFLAVVGPSGTGKSSFVLAGVLPLLPRQWKPLVFRPGATPLSALRHRLEAEGLPSLETALEDVVLAVGDDRVLVLVIDQFEELVTLCQDAASRDAFAAALWRAATHPSNRFRVVVTLRDDFLIKVQQLPAFRDTLSNSLQLLGTPAADDLCRVVTEPARRVGYRFDDEGLPRRMVEAVGEYSGALALLSFTASQLWEMRDRHLRLMRVKTYDALGGVGGALSSHAEATLAAMTDEEQKVVREAFRHLVTAQGTRAVLSKKEALEVVGPGPLGAGVIEKLVNARLLVSSETADGNDSIEVIHEALITAWPRLVGWQREDAEGARLRDSLRASARQWDERGRSGGLLWRKETLAEYRIWRRRFPGRLTQLEEAFAAASLHDESRSRNIRRALTAVAFGVLVVGLVIIFRAYRTADHASSEAKARLQRLWQEQSRLALVAKHPMEAWIYADAAQKAGATGTAVRTIQSLSEFELGGFLGEAGRVEGRIVRMRLNSDESQVAAVTSGGDVAVFRTADHSEAFRLTGRACSDALFDSSSPRRLLAVCGESYTHKELVAIDVDSKSEEAHAVDAGVFKLFSTTRGPVGRVIGDTVLRFTPEGAFEPVFRWPSAEALEVQTTDPRHLLVFAGSPAYEHSPMGLTVLNPEGQVLWQSPEGPVPVTFAHFDEPSGVVVYARNGELAAADIRHPTLLWTHTGHSGKVLTALVVGKVVYSAGDTGKVIAQDLRTGQLIFDRVVSTGALSKLLRAEGALFVGGADGIVRKLDLQTGVVRWEHHGHQGQVSQLLAVGQEVYSSGQDGIIRRWNDAYPVPNTLDGGFASARNVAGTVVLVEGDVLVSMGADGGTARLAVPLAAHGPVHVLDRSDDGSFTIEAEKGGLVSLGDGGWKDIVASGSFSTAPSGKTWLEFIDNRVQVFDRATGQLTADLTTTGVGQVMLMADDDLLGASERGDLIEWKAVNRGPTSPTRTPAHQGVFSITRTADPRHFLTVGYDRTAALWNRGPTGPQALGRVTGLPVMPSSISLSADETQLFLMSASGDVWVYDLAESTLLASLNLGLDTAEGAIDADSRSLYWRGQRLRLMPDTPLSNCRLSLKVGGERLTPTVPGDCQSR